MCPQDNPELLVPVDPRRLVDIRISLDRLLEDLFNENRRFAGLLEQEDEKCPEEFSWAQVVNHLMKRLSYRLVVKDDTANGPTDLDLDFYYEIWEIEKPPNGYPSRVVFLYRHTGTQAREGFRPPMAGYFEGHEMVPTNLSVVWYLEPEDPTDAEAMAFATKANKEGYLQGSEATLELRSRYQLEVVDAEPAFDEGRQAFLVQNPLKQRFWAHPTRPDFGQ